MSLSAPRPRTHGTSARVREGVRGCQLSASRLRVQYGARWVDVDWNQRVTTIPKDKRGRTTHVPLNDAAFVALTTLRRRQRLDRVRLRWCLRAAELVRRSFGDSQRRRNFVALPAAHLCIATRDVWRRHEDRGRVATRLNAADGYAIRSPCTRLRNEGGAADAQGVQRAEAG
jgi:hypothetical protein